MTTAPFNKASSTETLAEKLDRLATAVDTIINNPSADVREVAAYSAAETALGVYRKFYAMTRNDPLTRLNNPDEVETNFARDFSYQAQAQPEYSDARRKGTEANIQSMMGGIKANINILRDDPNFAVNNLSSQANIANLILDQLQTAVVAYGVIKRETSPIIQVPKERKPPTTF